MGILYPKPLPLNKCACMYRLHRPWVVTVWCRKSLKIVVPRHFVLRVYMMEVRKLFGGGIRFFVEIIWKSHETKTCLSFYLFAFTGEISDLPDRPPTSAPQMAIPRTSSYSIRTVDTLRWCCVMLDIID